MPDGGRFCLSSKRAECCRHKKRQEEKGDVEEEDNVIICRVVIVAYWTNIDHPHFILYCEDKPKPHG